MKFCLSSIILFALTAGSAVAQTNAFQPLPELPYRAEQNFFHYSQDETGAGEVSAVAVNSKGHIFVFQRAKQSLVEFDGTGHYIRQIAAGLFDTPHGLRFDPEDNIWITDVGAHQVLKLDPNGRVLLVLGRKGTGAEADWLFYRPADVAFGHNGEFFVADGYGNSRIMHFDHDGKLLNQWGVWGKGPGEFQLPHSIVLDKQEHIYVADREGARIQIFDYSGKFLKEWDNIGNPYGLFMSADQHLWMSDGGYDRLLEFDLDGKIIGQLGSPGHGVGQFVWPHFLAMGPNRNLYVADVLNWRVDVFVPTGSAPTGKVAAYVPVQGHREFDAQKPSTGWWIRRNTK